jgi:phosphatidylglycerol:prolipoprotein diacylglycerol transferase
VEIPFDPDIHLAGFRISWHALLALVGMVVGAAVAIRLGRPRFTFDQGYAIAVAGVVGGLIGSRVFHVIDAWSVYASDPIQALAVWNGGASIVGGAVGGPLAAAWMSRRVGAPLGAVLDVGAVGLGLGMAIGRLGDIVNGEHHAVPCDGAGVCVEYSHPATLGQGTTFAPPDPRAASGPVHLAVGYELVWDLVAVAVVLWLLPRAARLGLKGRLLFVFLAVYGAGRFALGALRLDPPWILGLQQAQIVSLVFVALGVAAVATRRAPASGPATRSSP